MSRMKKKNVQKHPIPRRTYKIDLPFPLWACYRYPENVLPQMDNLLFRDVLRHFSTKKYQSRTDVINSSVISTTLVDPIDIYYI